jgi:2-polyprenyl-3-methyl-5-hydroxy-6-metoxy-1,4-benzoquinol methylase
LAKKGFDVEGLDISPEAVDAALQNAATQGLGLEATVVDLEGDYQIQKDAYDVIVCFNYLQRTLIPQIKKGIRTGGMVVYETYMVDQARFGKPRNPDHLLKYNELLDMFREFRCLRYHEGIFEDRKAVAAIIAQKV